MKNLSVIALLVAMAAPAHAEDLAVLIGVERYQELRRVSRADDITNGAAALRGAGYRVATLTNANISNTQRVLQSFAQDADEADRMVVGLSGRFVTDGVRTWLLASDADAPALFGMNDAVSIDSVLRVMADAAGQAVLVLGYEANDTNAIDQHLRYGIGDLDIPQGVTVVMGAPDDVRDVAADVVTVPGANVMGYVRSTRGLRAAGYQPDVLVMQPAVAPVAAPSRVEPSLRAWNDAQEENTADAYRNFLRNNPGSPFSDEARALLREIETDPIRMAELAEASLDMSREERRVVQRNLTLLGFDTRGVDGIFGNGTRTAIRNWQQQNGYQQTSFLSGEQRLRLEAQASLKRAEQEAEAERARAETLRLDRAYWEETGAAGTSAGYRAYLDRYPEGIFASEATTKLEALNAEPSVDEARDREDSLNINPILKRLIETRLASMGYSTGQVDGRFDNSTRDALRRYQSDSGLRSTGYVDQATLARLLTDAVNR